MKLYSTPDRKIIPLELSLNKVVTLYTCGPTVYDYPHVGNWYTFIRYDLLNRTLNQQGYSTKWVINITDVGHLVSDADAGEDKLEKGAKRDGRTAWDVAKQYGDYFITALERLNFSDIYMKPKATDYIDEQIELVKNLEARGFTYTITDGVYFDTSKFSQYSDYAHLNVESLEEGARVEVNSEKRQHTDFALWKFTEKDVIRDMEWDSPWGKGFPGWHLECSAMIHAVLGEPIDIHGGGIDHISIHHTNEIAQSVCGYGSPLARYWFHTNHIQVDGTKMSKSLGNFYTLEDIENKGFSLEVFRLHVSSGHYRSQSEFSFALLESTKNRYEAYTLSADMRWQPLSTDDAISSEDIQKIREAMENALSEDLNTPLALSYLDDISSRISDKGIHVNTQDTFNQFLEFCDDIFGLTFHTRMDISNEQKELIQLRSQYRENKEWEKSDHIRDKLAIEGITIRDNSRGTFWSRVNL